MGSPKALLAFRGETFLDRLIGLFSRRCSPVIVVLGARPGDRSRRAAPVRGSRSWWKSRFPPGQISSMQCGLRAVPPDADGVLFTLVDHPAVASATIDALLDAAPASALLRIPRYAGRRGHPIWFPALIPEFLALPAGSSAREVVNRHESRDRLHRRGRSRHPGGYRRSAAYPGCWRGAAA